MVSFQARSHVPLPVHFGVPGSLAHRNDGTESEGDSSWTGELPVLERRGCRICSSDLVFGTLSAAEKRGRDGCGSRRHVTFYSGGIGEERRWLSLEYRSSTNREGLAKPSRR